MRSARVTRIFVIVFVSLGLASTAYSQNYEVSVSAGAFERQGSVVSFPLPDPVAPGHYRMRSDSDEEEDVLLQVDDHNDAWFVLENLSAGDTATYILNISSQEERPGRDEGISYTVDQNTITFRASQGGILSYYHKENNPPPHLDQQLYSRAGYIHPVLSPDGIPLTNHLDSTVHPHHYGIWTAWTSTEFQGRTPDFWNVHSQTGRVIHADSLDSSWEGVVHGGLTAKNYYVDLSSSVPIVALNERWQLRVYNTLETSNYNMFDLVVTQTANTAHPLTLPKYHYGGMAFRGHEDLNNPQNVSFLTSAGLNRAEANETRARWTHMGGLIDGQQAGIAVLGHPGNEHAPQPIRIHPETPYFVYAPMQLGPMQIVPGSPYKMRYRYITYDGAANPELLDRLWRDYAYPPGVTVEIR